MAHRLLIIGTGGHGKAVLGCVVSLGYFGTIEFATNIDEFEPISHYRILDERSITFQDIAARYDGVVVAIGDNHTRLKKIKEFVAAGVALPSIIHPSAVVSEFAQVGYGSVVMAGAVVNPFAQVGNGCIINTGAIVEHDCLIEDGAHLSPNSAIGGGSSVGACSWLCIGSNMADHVKLAANSVLAGGSCLIHDASIQGLYAGAPAILKREATI